MSVVTLLMFDGVDILNFCSVNGREKPCQLCFVAVVSRVCWLVCAFRVPHPSCRCSKGVVVCEIVFVCIVILTIENL